MFLKTLNFYIRVGLMIGWFFIGTFLSMLVLTVRWKDPSVGAILGRIVNLGGRWFGGFKMNVENQSRLYTSQPCVYVANHQSNMDIITMGCMYPFRTVIIGKKELKWVPLFGLFFVGSGMIMIDRKNRTQSVAGLEQAKEAMLKRGVSIWLFPEGTRNRGAEELLPFKKGAFHIAIAAQVPVVPIVHQHLKSYIDVDEKRVYNRNSILIRVLEPIPTVGLTSKDVGALTEKVRARMIEELRKPEFKGPAFQKPELAKVLQGPGSSNSA